MPAGWHQDFDLYLVDVDDRPATVVVDLAARAHAPVASHPLRLDVRVAMRTPRPDGLRDASELDALGDLESRLAAGLGRAVDAIYVGRAVFGGHTLFHYYLPAAARERLVELVALTGPLGDYRPTCSVDDDPSWGVYRELLAPDPFTRAAMWNRRLLCWFREQGDRLEVARRIDHGAYFPDRARAERTAAALRGRGFTVDPLVEPTQGAEWHVGFHREDDLDGGRPEHFCREILEIVLAEQGRYDGWGAPRVSRSPAL